LTFNSARSITVALSTGLLASCVRLELEKQYGSEMRQRRNSKKHGPRSSVRSLNCSVKLNSSKRRVERQRLKDARELEQARKAAERARKVGAHLSTMVQSASIRTISTTVTTAGGTKLAGLTLQTLAFNFVQSISRCRCLQLAQETMAPSSIDEAISAFVDVGSAEVSDIDEFERWKKYEPKWTKEQYLEEGNPVIY
jgi:hypothetical protein